MKYCRKCHATSPDDDTFCSSCGSRLVKIIDRTRGEKDEEEPVKPVRPVKIVKEKPVEEKKPLPQPLSPNVGYSFERQRAAAPKVDLNNLRPRIPSTNVKKLAVGGVIAVAVFGFFYMMFSNSSSITAFLGFLGSTSDSTESLAAESTGPKCTTITELDETKTPYTYVFNHSVPLNSLSPPTMKSSFENEEDVSGYFTVVVKFTDSPGPSKNISQEKWVDAHTRETFEIDYDEPVSGNLIGLAYVTPAVETRYFSTFENVTVEKCEETNSTS